MNDVEKKNFKKIKKFIKKFLKENDDGFVPDWENKKEQKFFIGFCFDCNIESDKFKFYLDWSYEKLILGVKYMSKENAEKLVKILNTEDTCKK